MITWRVLQPLTHCDATTQHLAQANERCRKGRWTVVTAAAAAAGQAAAGAHAPTDVEYDAVIIGGGMGGLTTATQLAAKGAKVVVLEKCALSPMP